MFFFFHQVPSIIVKAVLIEVRAKGLSLDHIGMDFDAVIVILWHSMKPLKHCDSNRLGVINLCVEV